MPFGLTNAPSVFQRYMNHIFYDLLDMFVVIYIDDILVFSRTKEEHIQHVKEVLKRLELYKLQAKLSKSFFNQTKIEFLGFILSESGISLAQDKLKVIKDWPIPKNLVELQSFLGFANFYRQSIRDYSLIVLPLTDLTRRSIKWIWNEDAQEAFIGLKTAMANAPTRKHPDFDRKFTLETDASNYALGAALLQLNDQGELLPILFHSRKLSKSELNYSVYDKELLAIVEAFSLWRHFLIASPEPISVLSDHRNLIYFTKRRMLTPRHARWALILSEFNYIIDYRPGSTLLQTLSQDIPNMFQLKKKLS